MLAALFLGGVDTGWTFYTPYSTMFSNSYVVLTLVGIFVVGFSSIATGVNFIVTVHTMRVPGLAWFKLPLFVWAIYATSLILVLATPILAITTLLAVAERLFQIGVFDPAHGGDPLLFQHLFWFYSHPAVYIMVLPAMGVVSEIIPCFAAKRVFGYRFMAYAILAIAAVGFLVWGHHMFVSGQSVAAEPRLLAPQLHRRRAVGDQGLQLDGDALQGPHPLRRADALRARLRRPLHDRRPVGPLSGLAGPRRPPHRHLLHRRPLPLHHGRRRGHGLLRRAALLVAEDDRPDVSPRPGPASPRRRSSSASTSPSFRSSCSACRACRAASRSYPPEFQGLNVMSSAGAGVLAIGYLLPLVLSRLVALVRRARRPESLGRDRPRVADPIAAADAQLRHAARGAAGRLRLHAGVGSAAARPGRPMSAAATAIERAAPPASRDEREARRETAAFGMWVFLASEAMFFGGLLFAYAYGRLRFPGRLRRCEPGDRRPHRHDQYRRPPQQQLARCARGDRGRSAPSSLRRAAARRNGLLGLVFLALKAVEYHGDWARGFFPGAGFRLGDADALAAPAGRRTVLHAVLHDDRPACAAHDDRRRLDGSGQLGRAVPAGTLERGAAPRSRRPLLALRRRDLDRPLSARSTWCRATHEHRPRPADLAIRRRAQGACCSPGPRCSILMLLSLGSAYLQTRRRQRRRPASASPRPRRRSSPGGSCNFASASATLRTAAFVGLFMLGLLATLSGVDYATRLVDPASVQAPKQLRPLLQNRPAS